MADALHQWALTGVPAAGDGEAVCHPWQPLAHWVVQSGVWWREGPKIRATIAWEELLARYPQVTREDVVQWAELLNQLDTSQRWIHWDEKHQSTSCLQRKPRNQKTGDDLSSRIGLNG